MDIILASNSPRRKEILGSLGVDFRVDTADVDENIGEKDPKVLVETLAKMKAQAVFNNNQNSVVIAGDTVVAIGDEILGKPCDRNDGKRMLEMLSGNVHSVYSGYCVMGEGFAYSGYEKTDIEFDVMSEEEIEAYLDTNEYCDKAGAYAIQGLAAKHIKGIKGCYYNVVGMPINAIYNVLKKVDNCL